MGSCLSFGRGRGRGRGRRRTKNRSWLSSPAAFDGIRIVHLSGYVEDFEEPVTVRQVTGKPPTKHFVCSSAHLLSFGSKPLSLDAELERGRLYFLLPHSILQSASSQLELVSLATRLTAIAGRCGPAKSSLLSSSSSTLPSSSPSPPTTTTSKPSSIKGGGGLWVASGVVEGWKPVLETIEEKSFDRRSDLSSFNSETIPSPLGLKRPGQECTDILQKERP